jgi:hypothetical protein
MKTFAVVCTVMVLGIAGPLMYWEPVEAIPAVQEDCADDFQDITSLTFVPVPGVVVSINNGLVSRNVVVQFGADAGVTTGTQLDLAYSIDGGASVAIRNFTRESPGGTRAALDVFFLGPGTHVIQPMMRVAGPGHGAVSRRCLTAEGRTR